MSDRLPKPRTKQVPVNKTPRRVLDKFLKALSKGSTVTMAARHAGIGRHTAYSHYHGNPEFRARWDDAIEQGTDLIEDVALQRAVDHSDVLAITILKARRPEVYREILPSRASRALHAPNALATAAVRAMAELETPEGRRFAEREARADARRTPPRRQNARKSMT